MSSRKGQTFVFAPGGPGPFAKCHIGPIKAGDAFSVTFESAVCLEARENFNFPPPTPSTAARPLAAYGLFFRQAVVRDALA
jgi:hypothetical protein